MSPGRPAARAGAVRHARTRREIHRTLEDVPPDRERATDRFAPSVS
ncbi:hypothetical protein ABZ519_29050 [Streptomyces collinus]